MPPTCLDDGIGVCVVSPYYESHPTLNRVPISSQTSDPVNSNENQGPVHVPSAMVGVFHASSFLFVQGNI